MAELFTLTARAPEDIRDSALTTLRVMLRKRGVEANVSDGSDFHAEFTAIANELAVVEANSVLSADRALEDTSEGDDLLRLGALREVTPRAAAGSKGPVIFASSATSLVTTGAELLDSAGLRYRVVVGGSYANGATITIEAIDTGEGTNHQPGDVLRWKSAPAFADQKVVVGPGGLVNGAPVEDEETFRQRLLARLQNPPASANWQQVIEFAEASDPSVQKGFAYPAVQGPSTYHVAVTARPTATSKSRVVAPTTIAGQVRPFVIGKLDEHVHAVVTGTTDVEADIAIGLILPASPAGSPPGPGGGWVDGSPWPTVDGATAFRVAVTAVVSDRELTVDAATPPTIGVSRVAWVSRSDWTVKSAVVIGYSGVGPYTVTLDTPFVGVAVGDFIFPQCERQAVYLAAVLAAFALLGPAEKTSNASALVRGYRHPPPSQGWASSLGGGFLKVLTDVGEEVASATWLYRDDDLAAATTSTQAPRTLPPPPSVEDAPRIFVPRRIAFYPVTP